MAKLIKCKDCGGDISKDATQCPHCGSPIKKAGRYGFGTLLLILFVGYILSEIFFAATESGNTTSRSPTSPSSVDPEAVENEVMEMQRRLRAENQSRYENDRAGILAEIQDLIDTSDYSKAAIVAQGFSFAGDAEIDELAAEAVRLREKATAAERTKTLLAELKKLPVSEFEANAERYLELTKLNPENSAYQDKLAYYRGQIKAREDAKLAEQRARDAVRNERRAKFGEPPVQSPWSGSYYVVENYLKQIANDPDSIEVDACTDVYYTDDGWLVGCDYRGRNAFGGMVRKSNWFMISHGRVIAMHDADRYKP